MADNNEGDIMRKFILILSLCSIFSACATPTGNPTNAHAMISFASIADEISVNHELFSQEPAIARSVLLDPASGQ